MKDTQTQTVTASQPSANSEPDFGFVRVSAASHPIAVANPQANVEAAIALLDELPNSQVVCFGELSLTGYSCGDLFSQQHLLNETQAALMQLAETTRARKQIVVAGLPLQVEDKLFNCAALLAGGRILGIVPKQFLPNYQEFYEARWFHAAEGLEVDSVEIAGAAEPVPFGIDLLFAWDSLKIGIEVCEDLWMPTPPSSSQALAGANLLLNLSASNELVGKADWREVLVRSQSGRCLAAYAYASAGPTESTTDTVLGAHCMVAENGALLSSSNRIGLEGCGWIESTHATADIDLQKLTHDRRVTTSWQQAATRQATDYRIIDCDLPERSDSDGSQRIVNATPFVPKEGPELHERCAEIFGIQCASLAKRVRCLPPKLPLYIGVSGGLDSTLALLVAAQTSTQQNWEPQRIKAITMPGFGTTSRTLTAAQTLMKQLDVEAIEIDIRELCLSTFTAMGHRPFGIPVNDLDVEAFTEQLHAVPDDERHDLVFENVQARTRTMLLMNHGFVLGTGDLSEQALGWSTYNGDHMSMYNVNTSIPKTLVKFLVQYAAENQFDGATRECLIGIVDTPISPELLPPTKDGKIDQHTEDTIGPYELHDFFLYHMIRFGSSPKKILRLAQLAKFSQDYSESQVRETLRIFLRRFFANQFKRSCVPDGPKVGSVSLSPRGDWRMPSDADAAAWLSELE
ncbi:MAG: NAD(+) synthase [Pirellulaceae bacterium]